ncbi:protein kinase [Streptomyces fructofermentans]|uniref:serine/threonine-protein kinase n=1 Tax=Streptomyces fructofermentans TaxID=152141 RepID=UPI0037B010BF
MLVAERYRLQASIGRGGMGEVWQATDEVLGRAVAVKLLLGDEADSASSARFRLEAQTAARLSHPYVVAVFDFGAWDDRFYLVMELVEGRSLAQELTESGTLGTERVAAVATQAAAGLAAAHREGIVHRDIKPGNLLSDAQGTVKIGDFGIARFVDDPSSALTTAGQIVGTSLYLAPERALGRPASAASDVYSLGCVLYQLLTGRPPFQAESATITLHQHIDMAPVPPRERGVRLPPAFENYLLGLLAKQPEDRPTAQEVADWFGAGAWRGHAEPLPQAAGPAPRRAEQPSGSRRAQQQSSSGSHRAQPQSSSGSHRAQQSSSGSHRAQPPHAPGQQRPGTADNGGPTTYRLPAAAPTAARGTRAAPSRRGRSGGGDTAARRSGALAVLAGIALFALAVWAGMTMFSPDDTGPENGRQETPSNSAPATGTPARGSGDGSGEAPGSEPGTGTVARTVEPAATPPADAGTAPPAAPADSGQTADTIPADGGDEVGEPGGDDRGGRGDEGEGDDGEGDEGE